MSKIKDAAYLLLILTLATWFAVAGEAETTGE